jgi:hypothetical protein
VRGTSCQVRKSGQMAAAVAAVVVDAVLHRAVANPVVVVASRVASQCAKASRQRVAVVATQHN